MVVLALLLSSLSLALQLKSKPTSLFDKYSGPARMSEYEYRTNLADQHMMKEAIPMQNGVGVPFVRQLSDDHQRILCRAMVSEEYLPKAYNERRVALLKTAYDAVGAVTSEFELSDDVASRAVKVEFVSIEEAAKGAKSEKGKVYAEFNDGDLTFH